MRLAPGSRAVRALAALAIAALAFGLRERAAEALPFDADEGWYVEAAETLMHLFRSGELAELERTNPRPEHPQLSKLFLAAANLAAALPPPGTEPRRDSVARDGSSHPPARRNGRTASAVAGALEVLVLALIQPLAGLFLAIHNVTIKYTSLAMLEAPPALLSLTAVASYVRFKRSGRSVWLIASATGLGLTAASKYVYALVGVVILIDWCLELLREPSKIVSRRVLPLLLWGLGSLLVFFGAYPYLWPDPFWRLEQSLVFHTTFSANAHVQSLAFPFWQPLVWLTARASAASWPIPYFLRLDPLIAFLALLGFDRLLRKERVYALWLALGLLFLLVWNTKWPHYVLILTAPLCLAAAEGARRLLSLPSRLLRGQGARHP